MSLGIEARLGLQCYNRLIRLMNEISIDLICHFQNLSEPVHVGGFFFVALRIGIFSIRAQKSPPLISI